MCRNITTLRGLQPAATGEEIEAAARQYVRKVSGVQKPLPTTMYWPEFVTSLGANAAGPWIGQVPANYRGGKFRGVHRVAYRMHAVTLPVSSDRGDWRRISRTPA